MCAWGPPAVYRSSSGLSSPSAKKLEHWKKSVSPLINVHYCHSSSLKWVCDYLWLSLSLSVLTAFPEINPTAKFLEAKYPEQHRESRGARRAWASGHPVHSHAHRHGHYCDDVGHGKPGIREQSICEYTMMSRLGSKQTKEFTILLLAEVQLWRLCSLTLCPVSGQYRIPAIFILLCT